MSNQVYYATAIAADPGEAMKLALDKLHETVGWRRTIVQVSHDTVLLENGRTVTPKFLESLLGGKSQTVTDQYLLVTVTAVVTEEG